MSNNTMSQNTATAHDATAHPAADLEDIIGEAIVRSRSRDEIVLVHVTVGDLDAAVSAVHCRSESCDYVETEEMGTGRTRIDIWGDDGQGGEFRLYIVATSNTGDRWR
jgi:hypothetical protein